MAKIQTVEKGWIVMRRGSSGSWYPLIVSVASTRKEAIRRIDNCGGPDPGFYTKFRKRGEMLAVHCNIRALIQNVNRLIGPQIRKGKGV